MSQNLEAKESRTLDYYRITCASLSMRSFRTATTIKSGADPVAMQSQLPILTSMLVQFAVGSPE